MALCDGCSIPKNPDTTNDLAKSNCYITFMERAKGDMYNILDLFPAKTLIKYEFQLSLFYQILIAVHAMHKYYAMIHVDLKSLNILILKTKPIGYFEYVINGKSYFIKNTGCVPCIADFGVSETLSPLYGKNVYGSRNAEVMKADDGKYYWKPIVIKGMRNIYWHGENDKYVAGTNNYLTDNDMSLLKNSSTIIDLNDNQRFPAFEFFGDIQDTIRMFTGGFQVFQRGYHPRPIWLNNDLLRKLFHLTVDQGDLLQTHGDTVKFVRADLMLDYLYEKPKNVNIVVDTFVM